MEERDKLIQTLKSEISNLKSRLEEAQKQVHTANNRLSLVISFLRECASKDVGFWDAIKQLQTGIANASVYNSMEEIIRHITLQAKLLDKNFKSIAEEAALNENTIAGQLNEYNVQRNQSWVRVFNYLGGQFRFSMLFGRYAGATNGSGRIIMFLNSWMLLLTLFLVCFSIYGFITDQAALAMVLKHKDVLVNDKNFMDLLSYLFMKTHTHMKIAFLENQLEAYNASLPLAIEYFKLHKITPQGVFLTIESLKDLQAVADLGIQSKSFVMDEKSFEILKKAVAHQMPSFSSIQGYDLGQTSQYLTDREKIKTITEAMLADPTINPKINK